MIDFRRSIPPHIPELHTHIAAGLHALTTANDVGLLMRQSVAGGSEAQRAAGAHFLRPRFEHEIAASRIMLTNGTQNALLVLLQTLVGAGGLLVAENLTYGSLRALGAIAKVRLMGLDIDDHGILPDSLDAACRAHRPKALYCNPTVHNPTTAIMPEARRLALIDVARRHGIAIIEDDALGRLHAHAPRPIAAFAPDITWYVMSTTKCLSQGLRLAYLVAPDVSGADKVIAPVEHLSYWHPAPLTAALATHLVSSGAADQISAAIARECADREQLASGVLEGRGLHCVPGSMHIWIKLPDVCDRRAFASTATAHGVLVRPSDLFSIDDQPVVNAVRLSLSSPGDLGEVHRGLLIVRSLLEQAIGIDKRDMTYEVAAAR